MQAMNLAPLSAMVGVAKRCCLQQRTCFQHNICRCHARKKCTLRWAVFNTLSNTRLRLYARL